MSDIIKTGGKDIVSLMHGKLRDCIGLVEATHI